MSTGKVIVKGSERSGVINAIEIGAIDQSERVELAIILRPNPESSQQLEQLINDLASMKDVRDKSYIARTEFNHTFGSSEGDMQLVMQFAIDNGLEVVASKSRRTILLAGEAGQLSEMFGVKMKQFRHPIEKINFRGRIGPVLVPEELGNVVQAVLGLDNRPQAVTHFRQLLPSQASISSYTPIQIAKLYNFPQSVDGSGQSIGIIELGGGFVQSDIETYFSSLGIKAPKITAVSVDGATNSPTGTPSGPDGEVMLDIEIAGSIAPGTQITVYFAPNTDKGFLDAITTAIHDQRNRPSVISISWGSAENTWTLQAMQAYNQAFQDSSTLGLTICAAAGDNGSSDGQTDGLAHVDFPASAPFVLGCGGTRLLSRSGSITSEVVWNDESIGRGATGGGVSTVFSLPAWQQKIGVPPSANPGGHIGRGVPDVSGNADPATGYQVKVDGQSTVFGGTSAVAPLWSALLSLLSQELGKPVGFVNPIFYDKLVTIQTSSEVERGFDDITQGSNGAYKAGEGWDACTGLGSPDGLKLLMALGHL